MNVKHSQATLAAVKAAWEAGVRDVVIMAEHGIPKGSLVSIVRRKGWKRPWRSLKSLSRPQQAIYKKLRQCGVERRVAFQIVDTQTIAAALQVLRAASAPIVGSRGPAPGPHPASASNSGHGHD